MNRTGRVIVAIGLTLGASARAASQTTYRLTEELRIGGADAGPSSFSQIGGITVAPNGNLFVLDFLPAPQVRVFDINGRFIANAGRSGGGPGEYRLVGAMLRGPRGIHVMDPFGARVLIFGLHGELVEHRSLQFGVVRRTWFGTVRPDGTIIDEAFGGPSRGVPARQGPPNPRLRRIRPDGTVVDTIPAPDCRLRNPPKEPSIRIVSGGRNTVIMIPFVPTAQTVFAPDGTAWCSARDKYAIHRFRLGRPDTIASITRAVNPVPIPSDTLQKWTASLRQASARASESSFREDLIPKYLPVIEAMTVDDIGRLWVRRTDTPPDNPQFDLYDQDGATLGTVQGRGRIVGIPEVLGDRAWYVELDEDDIPFIVRAVIR